VTNCPMTKDVPLSDAEVKRFCDLGCSVVCGEELKKLLRLKSKMKGVITCTKI